jgi:CheY-like chemotaxis protein
MATILIVDDSQFQRAFLKKALACDGHRFLEAEDGHEGLHTALREQPDCILADLIMPRIQGLGLLEGLRENESLIPVLVVTADIQNQVREQCLALGAYKVLHKPVDPETLRQTVTEILGTHP